MRSTTKKQFVTRLLATTLLATTIFSAMPTTEARSCSNEEITQSVPPILVSYKDVKNGTKHKEQIEYLSTYGAYSGIAEDGENFFPSRFITRGEILQIIENLYGDRVKVDVKKPKRTATEQWVVKTLISISEQLGHETSLKSSKPSKSVTRSKFSYYLKSMIDQNLTKLSPKEKRSDAS